MKSHAKALNLFPRQLAVLTLASVIAVPVMAQQTQPSPSDSQNTPAAQSQSMPAAQPLAPQKEGFWAAYIPSPGRSG